MSFNTAISGLNAAQSDLEVTANNIANVNTTGFKKSRTEFGDIYATSALGSSSTAVGSGVILQAVTQQFNQGNMNFTSNTLDFGLSGEGFFILSPDATSSERIYSRAGAFGVNKDGAVVNALGQLMQVFPVNTDGTVTSTALSSTVALRLPDSAGSPNPTSEIDLGVNLSSSADELDITQFDPDEPDTYSASTSVTVFDSLGEPHIAALYFVRDNNPAPTAVGGIPWSMYTYIDGQRVLLDDGAGGSIDHAYFEFLPNGTLDPTTMVPTTFETLPLGPSIVSPISNSLPAWTGGPDPEQTFLIDIANNSPTQYASPFTVNSLSQDGYAIGRLSGLDVSDDGVVRASYTNGQTVALGKIALARFSNTQGLSQIGNTAWAATTESGEPLVGEAGTSSFGTIRSGALELSNVDLTAELVGLITAQRNFQANAKSIETANAITQSIINIR